MCGSSFFIPDVFQTDSREISEQYDNYIERKILGSSSFN